MSPGIGSAWVALLFAGLALPEHEKTYRGFAPRLIFRALAIGLAVVATWWFASLRGLDVPSTTSTLERLRNRIAAAALENDVTAERNLTTAALQIAPLDWTLYFQRAGAIATNDADDISGLNFEGDIAQCPKSLLLPAFAISTAQLRPRARRFILQ